MPGGGAYSSASVSSAEPLRKGSLISPIMSAVGWLFQSFLGSKRVDPGRFACGFWPGTSPEYSNGPASIGPRLFWDGGPGILVTARHCRANGQELCSSDRSRKVLRHGRRRSGVGFLPKTLAILFCHGAGRSSAFADDLVWFSYVMATKWSKTAAGSW